MIEVLQFIFQDFWHWLGAVLLLGVALQGLAATIIALHSLSSRG